MAEPKQIKQSKTMMLKNILTATKDYLRAFADKNKHIIKPREFGCDSRGAHCGGSTGHTRICAKHMVPGLRSNGYQGSVGYKFCGVNGNKCALCDLAYPYTHPIKQDIPMATRLFYTRLKFADNLSEELQKKTFKDCTLSVFKHEVYLKVVVEEHVACAILVDVFALSTSLKQCQEGCYAMGIIKIEWNCGDDDELNALRGLLVLKPNALRADARFHCDRDDSFDQVTPNDFFVIN
eukprot:966094_1